MKRTTVEKRIAPGDAAAALRRHEALVAESIELIRAQARMLASTARALEQIANDLQHGR